MSILSTMIQKQCLKEYEKELSAQSYTLEQWEAAQPVFTLDNRLSDVAVLYGDYMGQDSEGKDSQVPVFLPDFSPNRWDYEDYLGGAVYIREDLYKQIDWEKTSRRSGLKKIMNMAKQVGCEPAKHVRSILTGPIPGFVKLDRRPGKGTFEQVEKDDIKACAARGVSIIIPSKDNPDILDKCLESIEQTTGDMPLEIIIVDNGSCKEHRVRVEAMCKFTTEGTKSRLDCHYIYEPMKFHFSKMCNIGAEQATGEILLFLNDDVEAVEAGWLETMLSEALKPYTGAVGMKLLYPDRKRIQHAGIVNLPMGPVHKLQFADDFQVYYDKRNRGVHNVCAVTGACLMMRKDLFLQLGGMSEELPVAFNDVELCFHAMEAGYCNVVCCDTFMVHHESISRGQDNTEEKRGRLLRERGKLYEMHPRFVSFDAFYPYDTDTGYGLCHAYLDTAIRPAYEDGMVVVQKVQEVRRVPKAREQQVFGQRPEHEKLNPCLKLQVEQLYQEQTESIHVAGYSFVIGSDNCRFVYTLVLRGEDMLYGIELSRVRRNDLERNMPDQIHVGLAGFHVEIPVANLQKGRYRVEIYAKDKASGLRLKQNSNVYMNIG